MPQEQPLFRQEITQQQYKKNMGEVLCINSIQRSSWCLIFFAIATLLLFLLIVGQYAHKTNVSGVMMPLQGSVKIQPLSPGVVSEQIVTQGSCVSKGDVLYRITTEEFANRSDSFIKEQSEHLQQEILRQQDILALGRRELKELEHLVEKHFVSRYEYDQKHRDTLQQEIILADLKKNLADIESRRDYAVRAPVSGKVATVISLEGQYVNPNDTLAIITPESGELIGYLFAPARSTGFIHPGDRVMLKYQAFPYEKFGLYPATITTIDQTILLPRDLPLPNIPDEPFYRITVQPVNSYVLAYGQRVELTSGMLIDAMIIGETRKLWEWVLAPLLSLKGSLL